MKILGIESSCDETAASVVENGSKILTNVVASQIEIHKQFGGVVPEIAARSHLEIINSVINQAVKKVGWDNIDAIAVTSKPGLIGALMIGTLAARTYALAKNIPLISVHHIKGHIYANFLNQENQKNQQTQNIQFPILALVVSGGHTQIILLKSHTDFQILGSTRDDAIGEVFDKVAKIIGLNYPGGPELSKLAQKYQTENYTTKIHFPNAILKPNPAKLYDGQFDFSFSGLKTAVLRQAQKMADVNIDFPSYELAKKLTENQKIQIAYNFEQTATDTLVGKMQKAANLTNPKTIMLAGGVAANRVLRAKLQTTFGKTKIPIHIAPPEFCTDNAAMIASAAYFQIQNAQIQNGSAQNQANPFADPLDFSIAPRANLN
ncbi:MAG: tRNA (adenosine(37)-N6)-threonylcarbamoyltransferase complex transferase subunit TsaD [Candidatus Nomurabacteria bacterium]|jgi:N6-L-threonylcarbamoyladenine synthase|nr:tRNA (adenosine(37)-N6)-threonylcarbamoyltransferase complex transferase subunit TsaD [Candidatus Nomurabacteria bacterium]